MNQRSENKVEKLTNHLMQLCHENGIFHPEMEQPKPMDDLIDNGLIDSMGMVYMQGVIAEEFALEIELELFIAELRNMHSIAAYLAEQIAQDCLEKTIEVPHNV